MKQHEDAERSEINWLAQQSQSILMKDIGDAAAKMRQIFILLILATVLPGITVGARPSGVP